ncbi:MAG TPA: VOC family protein, partial [Anaerolineaceae bacterium]|nr:VOC family protein [Anaerolineaceae bacterium]
MIRIKKINHIGIAVKNLETSTRFWHQVLGLPLTNTEDVPSCKVRVAFLPAGESDIELLSPLTGNTTIDPSILEKGG